MITNKQSYLTGYMVGCRLREGRPSGVVEQWEMLFEGDVKSKSGYGGICAGYVYLSKPLVVGGIYRLTFNGESKTLTAIREKSDATIEQFPSQAEHAYIGNSDVGGGVSNGFENENVIDCDYCLLYLTETSISPDGYPYECYFYTAEAGTYSIKVERMVI